MAHQYSLVYAALKKKEKFYEIYLARYSGIRTP